MTGFWNSGEYSLILNPYRYVPPQRVWFLGLLVWKQVHTLRLILCGIGYCFRRNYGSVWTYLSFQFQMSKKEKEIWEFKIFEEFFFRLLCNLSNDDIPSAWRPSSLKTGVKNDIFWSEIGDFGEPGGTSPPRIPRRTLPPGFVICGVLEKEKLRLGILT